MISMLSGAVCFLTFFLSVMLQLLLNGCTIAD